MADKVYEYTTDGTIKYGVTLSDDIAVKAGLDPVAAPTGDSYVNIAALKAAVPAVIGLLPSNIVYRALGYTSTLTGQKILVPYMTAADFAAAIPAEEKPFPPDHTHTLTRDDTLTLTSIRGESR